MIAGRRIVILGVALALTAGADRATAQGFGLGASIGANVPNGKFGENATTGLVANGLAELRFSNRFGLRAEGFWSRSDLDNAFIRKVGNRVLPSNGVGNVSGNVNLLGAIGNVMVSFGPSAIQPYLIGGVGLYRQRFAQDIEGTFDEFRHIRDVDNSVGYNGGAGIRLSFLGMTTFIEGRYHAVGKGDSRTNFIPVTIGFTF
jgi:hypothetical protein